MTPTAEYSAMLYALAEETREEQGCVTASPEDIENAAERLDVQTVTINVLTKQRDELLAALKQIAATSGVLPSDIALAAIDCEKGYGRPDKSAKQEIAVPAIVFYPAGSLGEPIDIEGGTA